MTEQIVRKDSSPIMSLERMAHYVARSGLFGLRDPVQAVALMLIAEAEGRHPATAALDYHIIQGRPALRADAMLARFQAAGGRVRWTRYSDDVVAAVFSHPSGGELEISWDIERARRAGLAGRDNWRQYPRAMLRSRVISEGIRAVYPAIVVGIYTPEEILDIPHGLPDAPLPAPQAQEAPPPQALEPERIERPEAEAVEPVEGRSRIEQPQCEKREDPNKASSERERASAPPEQRAPISPDELRARMARMLEEMAWGDAAAAGDLLERLTRWRAHDGRQMAGKRSLQELSARQVPVAYRCVKSEYEKWRKVARGEERQNA